MPKSAPQQLDFSGFETGAPEDISSLFHEGGTYLGWVENNREKKRFFVPNVQSVVRAYRGAGGDPAHFGQAFSFATKVISEQRPKWHSTNPGTYAAGQSWVNDYRVKEPKKLALSATMIVGLEVAMSKVAPEYDVFTYLRVVPAYYFVDQFDTERLNLILAEFEAMPDEEKTRKFGEGAQARSFFDICYRSFGQTTDGAVLRELAGGHLVTKYVADNLRRLVNENFSASAELGEVKGAGESASTAILGTKDLAPNLKVPTLVEVGQIDPLPKS